MSVQMIPLTNEPNQSFMVLLTVDGAPLVLNVKVSYNEMAGYWILAISDINNNLLLDSVPMITGDFPGANILRQQVYMGIGAWYIVKTATTTPSPIVGYGEGLFGAGQYGGGTGEGGEDYPDIETLGSKFQLWVDDTPYW